MPYTRTEFCGLPILLLSLLLSKIAFLLSDGEVETDDGRPNFKTENLIGVFSNVTQPILASLLASKTVAYNNYTSQQKLTILNYSLK